MIAEKPESAKVHTEDNIIVESSLGSGNFDEADTIQRILDGAVDDFELLVQKHKSKIGRIVSARVRKEDIEEVAHRVFVQAFKALGSFSGRAPFENWISRLAVHCCHDYWRQERRECARMIRPGEDADYESWIDRVSAIGDESELKKAAEMEETRLALEQAMGNLDADERWLIESHYYEEMPLKEAAATLGWSLVKTKVKAMRARLKLRKAIGGLIKECSK